MYLLQKIVFPNLDIQATSELYIRNTENCFLYKTKEKIFFKENSMCSFDTYYNSFSIKVWHENTIVDNVKLYLRGSGKFLISVIHNRLHLPHVYLYDEVIDIEDGISINLGELSVMKDGMLFFQMRLISKEGELVEGFYYTEDDPIVSNIKLGIVVTHFNRKNYVLPAIKRINDKLLSDPYYNSSISLIVVDNSSNITNEEALNSVLIPNRNLGGSGGFTRGLLYLKDNNYTHCLFMDDDASCEIESIRRTYALLQFSKKDKFGVAGSLISEIDNTILREKGAIFQKNVKPLYTGLNMKNCYDLLLADNSSVEMPNYGAWWFFAFKISDVEKYPFPFFVRGDDILFGVTNKFNIATMNGIACWGEDFFIKESPMTRYLGLRGELTVRLLTDDLSCREMILTFLKRYLASLFSYNYASAKAINLAIDDILSGPDIFLLDLDASKARNKISTLTPDEKLEFFNLEGLEIDYPKFSHNKLLKLIRIFLINGLLLPSFFMKDRLVYQHKGFRATFKSIFRYKKVLYWLPEYKKGYIVTHDKIELFKGLLLSLKTILNIYFKYNNMKKLFLEKKDFLMSEDFWRTIYSQDKEN
ncbi:hypothetical protein QV01_02245 [Gallibacterium genomosp. 3]|uniref:Glycosyl transferase n=1 Tax=Gallibacterium genomosp. 3 TaxID=505345 RepID=A0A1A7NT88_9PAST|nr:glycosyltransferase [Gallibacterium genomosp. 3]OBW93447.1 hypothetical protein QV01_02245 [Gallibacterium genomosp. 3]